MPQLWAFIVGIEQYANKDWIAVQGASNDVSRVRNYLVVDRGVPSPNIVALTNEEATRKNIIAKFQSHLIHNTEIAPGDAILFHFSGHGSRSPAPENWPVIDRGDSSDESESGNLEMIMPYDEGMLDDEGNSDHRICGIPDRTLGALLGKVSKAHGNNVTVALDCCHSGHGTREALRDEDGAEFSVRGVDPATATPLREEVDRDIWGSYTAQSEDKEIIRGAFTERRSLSHVLMAACGPKERAVGNRHGGLFTTFWLVALRDKHIFPRTYAELLKHIDRRIEDFRNRYPRVITQHPQCEGVTRDRLVFEDTMMDARVFQSRMEGSQRCRIEAGEVQGITENTSFELYALDEKFQRGPALGSALVKELYSASCIAECAENLCLTGTPHCAMVLQQAYQLRYAVFNTAPSSAIAQGIVSVFEQGVGEATPDVLCALAQVEQTDSPDLVLEIDDCDGGGITFRRRDVYLRDLKATSPRMPCDDVKDADFPGILSAIARFNYFLAQANPHHPYAGRVGLEFHLLEPDLDGAYLDNVIFGEAKRLARKIPLKNDEATVTQSDDVYAVILRNTSSTPLYPYVMYFDPATYEISIWYTAFEGEKATLLSNSSLQIGGSAEHPNPFAFWLREGDHIDTSFIKVYLLEEKTRVNFMEQKPVIGRDESGKSCVRTRLYRGQDSAGGIEAPPRKGNWDSITCKMTVMSE